VKFILKKLLHPSILRIIKSLIFSDKLNSKDLINGNKLFIGSKNFYKYITRYKNGKFSHISSLNIFFYLNFFFINHDDLEIIIDQTPYFESKINIPSNFIFKNIVTKKKIILIKDKNLKKKYNQNYKIIEIDRFSVIDFANNNPNKKIDYYLRSILLGHKKEINILVFNKNDYNVLSDKIRHIKINYPINILLSCSLYKSIFNLKNYFKIKNKTFDFLYLSNNLDRYTNNLITKVLKYYFCGIKIILNNDKNLKTENFNNIFGKNYISTIHINNLEKYLNESTTKKEIIYFNEIFNNILKSKIQLNESIIKSNKVLDSFKNDVYILLTLHNLNHLKVIKQNIERIKIKNCKFIFLCHKLNEKQRNEIKFFFLDLDISKEYIFDQSNGHGLLLNKAIKSLKKNTIWIKLDHDDCYYESYIEEILSIIRISNCYFVGKKVGYFYLQNQKKKILNENSFDRPLMNKKHISGATMAGISNILNYCQFYSYQTNKLDVLMSKSCKKRNIDFYIGSGLNLRINRFENEKHTWKILDLDKNFGIYKELNDDLY
jgi:hypothetical protein